MIEFFVLESAKNLKSLHYICELVERWFNEENQIYIHVSNQNEAEQLDGLLWTYHPERFLPHKIYQTHTKLAVPIFIGYEDNPEIALEMTINLADNVPPFYTRAKQLIEFVFAGSDQEKARNRYKYYKSAGYEIRTHKLDSLKSTYDIR